MLKYKVKSLITAFEEGEVNKIGHQANCFSRMGAGIAPLLAKRWPEVVEADNDNRDPRHKLGGISIAMTERGWVFNLYGQYYPGKNTEYASLKQAMVHMEHYLTPSDKVGFPKLGCGIGGGDWSIVSKYIEEVFGEYDVTIYVLSETEIPENNS